MNIKPLIGNKAENILFLEENGFKIPYTKIYPKINEVNISRDFKSEKSLYMVRPSILGEDSREKSMAGYFKTIGPLRYYELKDFFNTHNKNLNILFLNKNNNFTLGSIIIQEYVQAEYYGVYFTRNPLNILLKGSFSIGEKFDSVTSGKSIISSKNIKYSTKLKLKQICKKIEKVFEYPQDIEFAIKGNDIYILQSRDITTGNEFYPNSNSTSGLFKSIDNGEFGDIKFFSGSLLSGICNIFILGNYIYAKPSINKKYSDPTLYPFISEYSKYMKYKKIASYLHMILYFQSLDKDVLKIIYQNYKYSFDIFTQSNIKEKLILSGNIRTKLFIFIENLKNESFKTLEKAKIEILTNNSFGKDIRYLTYQEFIDTSKKHEEIINIRKHSSLTPLQKQDFLLLINGNLLNYRGKNKLGKKWIYKGTLYGKKIEKINYESYQGSSPIILVLENLNDDITEYIGKVSGMIILSGSIYSHNAILLREHRIPSYISE